MNKLKRLLHSKITSILRDQAWFIMKYPTLIMAKLSTFVFVYNFCHCQRCQILNFVKVTKTGIFEKHLTVKIVKISGNAVQSTGQTTHKFTMQDQNSFRKIKKNWKNNSTALSNVSLIISAMSKVLNIKCICNDCLLVSSSNVNTRIVSLLNIHFRTCSKQLIPIEGQGMYIINFLSRASLLRSLNSKDVGELWWGNINETDILILTSVRGLFFRYEKNTFHSQDLFSKFEFRKFLSICQLCHDKNRNLFSYCSFIF